MTAPNTPAFAPWWATALAIYAAHCLGMWRVITEVCK